MAVHILNTGATVCKVGCAMSSVAMCLAGRGISVDGHAANPGTLNAYLKKHGGYSGNLIIWSKAPTHFTGLYHKTPLSTVNGWASSGKCVIANVRGGGHWVLVTNSADSSGNFPVNDPGFSQSKYNINEMVAFAVY